MATDEIRFVCDMMLGRLMRWLRILGYDALYPVELDDPELAALAGREGRVLLTRDKLLSETNVCQTYYVNSDDAETQLVDVVRKFGLETGLDAEPGFVFRCSKCNAPLAAVAKAAVEAEVPPKVFAAQDEFWRCSGCDHLYWKGTQWDQIEATLTRVRARLATLDEQEPRPKSR